MGGIEDGVSRDRPPTRNQELFSVRAYLLDHPPAGKLYLAFGENCITAAKALAARVRCDPDEFSVSGSWEVDPDKPIVVSSFWPHFTANPSDRHTRKSHDVD